MYMKLNQWEAVISMYYMIYNISAMMFTYFCDIVVAKVTIIKLI